MKIIGQGGDYSSIWLAEITREEIRKVLNYAYDSREPQIKVGVEIDLTQGYDFRDDIRSAARSMLEANNNFSARRQAFLDFANMITAQPTPAASEISDEALRAEWVAHGGEIHGPITETVIMSEVDYFAFRRKIAGHPTP